jgi:hypothetical protein
MITEAILKINPNAEVSVNADDINQITWHNGTTPISKADIEAQFPAVEFDTAMEDLRSKRDNLLKASDWVMISDSPIADKTAWETYRQSLRDITNGLTTVAEVDAVTFPVKP